MKKKNLLIILIILAAIGAIDSLYLTFEHYSGTVPPCTPGVFVDCGKVLQSKYSEIFGIALSFYGFVYYLFILVNLYYVKIKSHKTSRVLVILASSFGFLFSIYLMYLQIIVIGSICLYCSLSALISTLIFFVSQYTFEEERKILYVKKTSLFYRYLLRNILFLIDSETIHNILVSLGKNAGNSNFVKKSFGYLFDYKNPLLKQRIAGINFENPVGLAAGFDYDANLTQILPSIGFGAISVGTVTNMPYEGNPKPRLGRLIKSRSLMVNKGFKSNGAQNVSKKLKGLRFDAAIGVSIGRTNSPKLKIQTDSIKDIVSAFKTFEKANINISYYELNISCPNLIYGSKISYYPPKNLKDLLVKVDKLKLKKPVFIKMPIDKSDKEVLSMLKVISKYSPVGVIFGNLQKDRNHKSLIKEEVNIFEKGNFSGKPTFDRSNELISLCYKHYKDRFIIVGCGGIFSGKDAYEKITRGASLVQLITGLIYEGPQLASQINMEIINLLEKDGFNSISKAIGSKNK